MSSRTFRLETRSRARDEIKRIMQTVEKVRKWEKIWIETGLSNHLKVYKWVPVREEAKEEGKEESEEQKEEVVSETNTHSTGEAMDTALPEIQLRKEFPTATMETAQLSTDQLPPDLLLDSEASPATATAAPPVSRPSSTAALVASSTQGEKAGVSVQGEKAGGSVQGEKGGGSVQGEKGGGSAQGEKGGGSLQGEKGGGSAQAGGSVQGEEDGDASVDLSLLGATEDCVWLPKQKKFVQDKQQRVDWRERQGTTGGGEGDIEDTSRPRSPH